MKPLSLFLLSSLATTIASSPIASADNSVRSTQTASSYKSDYLAKRFGYRRQGVSDNFLRGVNIGSWLVLEKWITPDLFSGTSASDQYTFDQTAGAQEKLTGHWDTYFTQDDVQQLKSWGINALRIPIGFWAYDNANTPYISGADAYLQKAIGWAQAANMAVWIDLHGVPGSQNGFDNSGQQGTADWEAGDNRDRTIAVLQTMAQKYGTKELSNVVAGIELVNEPISWGTVNFTKTQEWTVKAVAAVRKAAANKKLQIIMHDSFQPVTYWKPYVAQIQKTSARSQFAFDTHLYQLFVDKYQTMDQNEHVQAACNWGKDTLQLATNGPSSVPIYAGEWTAATNVCVNPDGSTFPGTSTASHCTVPGCQCVADTDTATFSDATREQVKRFVNAQLATFTKYSSGYFYWNFKGPGTWSLSNGIEQGWIPNPVTSFTNVCS